MAVSSLPPPLGGDHTDRLPGATVPEPRAGDADLNAGTGAASALSAARALPHRSRARARRTVRNLLRRSFEVAGGRTVFDRLAALRTEVRRMRQQLDAMRADWVDAELRRARYDEALGVFEGTRVNLELLKGEVRELQHTLAELGMAFAPGTGLAGAAARFSELREAVNGLERRLRALSLPAARTGDDGVPAAEATAGTAVEAVAEGVAEGVSGAAPVAAPTSTLFNYVGFERRFRGDPEEITAALLERYGDLLAAHQPVVDIGCGRAELLGSLAARGVEVIGVEPDPGMVAEGRARGVTVHQALAGDYLRGVDDGSLGSIITTHVVEHLPLDAIVEMLELSVRKLRPGGVLVSETPNPSSLVVLGNSYILDPTHVLPLHPSLLAFLCESAGFRDVRLRFYSPASGYHLEPATVPDRAPEWAREVAERMNSNVSRLNDVLFGPQEYAVVATTPDGATVDAQS